MRTRLCTLTLLLMTTASGQEFSRGNWDMTNPNWLKMAADKLAECVGTYRGMGDFLRVLGRENSATFVEDSARGSLLAAMMLLTVRADLEGRVLYGDDSEEYIENRAAGHEGRFKMLTELQLTGDDEALAMMEGMVLECQPLGDLQKAIIESMRSMTLDNDEAP